MKKIHLLTIIAISVFSVHFLSACQKEDGLSKAKLGECSYYPGFLWSKADTIGVTKHLYLDFNDDAKEDKETFVEMVFVDKEGHPIPDDVLEITIDGVITKGNKFTAYSSDEEKKVTFRFLPKAENGNHQGYIKLTSYKLDRFDNQELSGKPVEVMRWDLRFNKCMNPLAKVMMWFCIFVMVALVLWFTLLKNIFYPRIRLSRLELSTKRGYYVNKKINGSRMVVATNNYKPQSRLSKLFTGKITYIKDELWTSSWEMTPKGRRKVAKINLHGKYMISPVTSEISNYGTYQLDNLATKESITLKIL